MAEAKDFDATPEMVRHDYGIYVDWYYDQRVAAFDRMLATVRADHEKTVRERIAQEILAEKKRRKRLGSFPLPLDIYEHAARIVRESA